MWGAFLHISGSVQEIIKNGSVKIRVVRSGMFQQLTFSVKRAKHGNITYVELYTDRMVDLSELTRISNDIGLPVEAQNGKAFPRGKSVQDFQESVSTGSAKAEPQQP